jgi:hypothetical protein
VTSLEILDKNGLHIYIGDLQEDNFINHEGWGRENFDYSDTVNGEYHINCFVVISCCI